MSTLLVPIGLGLFKTINYIYEFMLWPYDYLTGTERKWSNGEIQAMQTRKGDPSSPWRNVASMEKLDTTMYPGCETLDDLWYRAVRLWPDRNALGTREVISSEFEIQPNGKQFKKMTLGEYHWETYAMLEKRVANFGSGLLALGAKPKMHVVIFAETRAEWLICAQACFRYNLRVVTLYATLGDEAIVYGITESEASFVITSNELLGKVATLLPRLPKVTHVIFMNNAVFGGGGPDGEKTRQVLVGLNPPPGVKLLDMFSVECMGGKPERMVDPKKIGCKPRPDDLALIMYTSGSTGLPKGVEITHRNLMCNTAGELVVLPRLYHTDLYVAYLPLAHVLELCCELVILSGGIPIGYSSAQTLTDNGTKIKAGSRGDVHALRPTLMACVPTILDRLSKTVWEKVNSGGALPKAMFTWAFEHKRKRLSAGYASSLLDRLIFRKVREVLGGNIRYMLSGGAPLSAEAHVFTYVCFADIIQGYGLTETCGAGTLLADGDLRCSIAGVPLTNLEIKLRDWSEGGYSPNDLPRPRGEILIGGPGVTRGYYKQPEKTAEAYITDQKGQRWFCTGDIGTFHADGTLSIIDRKKDLVKLQAGEYVSLGKVELALCVCPLVESICVYGDSLQHNTVCLMVPKRSQLSHLAVKLGLETMKDDYKTLCQHDKIRGAVLRELQKVGLQKGLERFEVPVQVYLDSEPWTPDSGLVTDAYKLKRREIQSSFQDKIDEMYHQKNADSRLVN